MKKLLLFAAVAGLGLVSASPPKGPEPAPREARADYPPCSRTVTDRCNQLRGHRGHQRHADHRGHDDHHAEHRGHREQHAEHRGHREHHAEHRGHREHHAEHRGHREHHAEHRDHARRYASRGGGHAMRAPAAAHRRVARVRRAGERG